MTTAVAEAVQRGLHPQLSCRINHSKRKASHYIQLEQATLSSIALLLSFLAKQKDDEQWLSRRPFRLPLVEELACIGMMFLARTTYPQVWLHV
jgi:hypothetical protein